MLNRLLCFVELTRAEPKSPSSVSEYSLRPTMYIMHIIIMVRLALHCFPICSLVVSIMTNSVFLGQAPSVLYP